MIYFDRRFLHANFLHAYVSRVHGKNFFSVLIYTAFTFHIPFIYCISNFNVVIFQRGDLFFDVVIFFCNVNNLVGYALTVR